MGCRMNPQGIKESLSCIPMNMGEVAFIGEMKTNHLIDTVLKGVMGHPVFLVVLTHERKRSLQLQGFFRRRNTPHYHE